MPDLDPMLDENEVSDDLLEPMLIGFGDTASQIRDETVKAMVYIMKKIKKRQQHNAAMLLFKCVEDSEPTIRVNTIICFAKIIPFVQQELVEKVVPQVWRLGLSDTFLKSRLATLEVGPLVDNQHDNVVDICIAWILWNEAKGRGFTAVGMQYAAR